MIAFTEQDAQGLISTFRGMVERVVVVSSADVYRAYGLFLGLEEGPIEQTPLTEEAPVRTLLYPYRAQAEGPNDFRFSYDKVPVEQLILSDPNLPGTIVRLPVVHGPGDPFHRLSAYLKRMDAGRRIILLDEGMAAWKCPRGEVENVAQAIVLAATAPQAVGRVYNIAEEVTYSEAEWVARIAQEEDWKGQVVRVPRGHLPVPYRWEHWLDIDSGRIRRELGYVEPVEPYKALHRTIAWERAHPVGQSVGIGLVDEATEDAILADLRLE
jgi:nucleoside-diphosphate-sugar epimerase